MRTPIVNLLRRSNRHKSRFEVQEELQFHIDMLERKYAEQGMPLANAKAAALKRFGNFEAITKQCVTISRRNSFSRRLLKTALVVIALIGLAIRILSSDINISHIGATLIMIAVSGRLLLYVRGLSPKGSART